jgi:hypothetical protein
MRQNRFQFVGLNRVKVLCKPPKIKLVPILYLNNNYWLQFVLSIKSELKFVLPFNFMQFKWFCFKIGVNQ